MQPLLLGAGPMITATFRNYLPTMFFLLFPFVLFFSSSQLLVFLSAFGSFFAYVYTYISIE